jgi:Domain of unknown function (DUF4177)
MAKYEYRFDSVPYKYGSTDYQQAIVDAAADGWRLVQVLVEIPASIPGAHVLILERPLS